ncbi:hypothetical protein EDC40_103651 [Aminobacter aminovorans]|uniref:Putative DnaT-like domain-containing protein n=1 Tax=Aminobacter aminovorans TaxID=83263 RepID=A0A380WKZ1_AMIAI|nr:DnaT-like ssDNA-binding protein [Aminobacter aminovorans]TCS28183.1 hypothetical protein EDC40_103651 [Aminobacter aminovorans]SUU89405.1 Uncharacterised protein [Aminobacter aminovorans]
MAGYGTNEGFTAYATAAGYTVPAGDIGAARQRGSTYVDGTYGARFSGLPTGGVEQERAWPRTGATAYGSALASDIIPVRVVNASYEAALLELQSPGSLSAVVSGSSLVKREKVEGAVEVEYAVSDKTDLAVAARPLVSVIDGMLAPLLTVALPGILVV